MSRIQIYDTTLRDGSQAEGISFSLQDKLAITERLDSLGVDYVEGGYPASNEKDAQYFQRVCELPLAARPGLCLRNDPPQGREGRGRRGPAGLAGLPRQDDHHRRQEFALPGDRGSPHQRRREPGDDPREHRPPGGQRPRGDFRRRTLLRRLEGRRRLFACRLAGGGRGRGGDGRALRHQRRHDAGGHRPGRAERGRVGLRAGGHPLPQRLRAGGGQFAGRRRRRGRAGPGHDQRLWRALRQRRSDLRDRQPGVEEEGLRVAGPRRRRALDRVVAVRLRNLEHELPPAPAVRRQERLCAQGRHARQRHRPQYGRLRAHRAGIGGQRAPRAGQRAFRPLEPRGHDRGTRSPTIRS